MAEDGFVSMGDTLRVRIEDDLVFIRNERSITLADVYVIIDLYGQIHGRHGSLFAMYDSSRSQGVEWSARTAITAMAKSVIRADATAIFGASFATRTVGNMIDRALVALGMQSSGMRFYQTEADAREYLQQRRLHLKPKD